MWAEKKLVKDTQSIKNDKVPFFEFFENPHRTAVGDETVVTNLKHEGALYKEVFPGKT